MMIPERRDYLGEPLRKSLLKENPFDQFQLWLKEALEKKVLEPNAMVLATASKKGRPSSRTVLLKEIDDTGFIFYTNTQSRKGKEIAENPVGTLTILWLEFPRQVVIEGSLETVGREKTETYFATRPRKSQIGAFASKQGEVLASREELETKFQEIEQQFENQEIPTPEDWGGYRLIPESFEFWQGRKNRIHDRFLYLKEGSAWTVKRLSP